MHAGLATRHAPSFSLVRAWLVLGLAGGCAFAAALLVAAPRLEGHHFQPVLLGLVHLCVLGWLMPIALGALHQLVPVVFEVPVRSERLAWVALPLYVAGASGLVGHMFALSGGWGLPFNAGLLTLALWLCVANLLATLLQRARARSLTGAYVLAAFLYLVLGSGLGLLLACNLWRPFLAVSHLQVLRAHAHAAGLGFFGLLVMGVAYRLLEMFLLSHGARERAGWVALVALNVGLPLLVGHFAVWHSPWLLGPGVAAVAVGVAAFLVQVRAIWTRRMRRLPDAAWRLTLASFAYLAVAVALGAVLAGAPLPPALQERLVLAYGLLALPGFVGSVVVGQLYKIVPFLIWLHRFSPLVGLRRVPSASELLPEGPKRVQAWLMHAGLLGLAAGIVLPHPALRLAGAAVFAASAALGARNLTVLLRSRP